MTLTVIAPDQQYLVPPLPNPDAVPPNLRLIRIRNQCIDAQLARAPITQETIITKRCYSLADEAIAWVACTRTSPIEITYRIYAHWNTRGPLSVTEGKLLVYEMREQTSYDEPLVECAEHIGWITIEGDSVTIYTNNGPFKIPKSPQP